MEGKKHFIAITLATLITAGLLFHLTPIPSDSFEQFLTEDQLQCVSRTQMVSRGEGWIGRAPYDPSRTFQGYRADCSGFVSMCWKLSQPGLTTGSLPSVTNRIGKDDLQPGDALLNPGSHVVLFVGWASSDRSHYIGMENANSNTGCVKRVIKYPYFDGYNPEGYYPARYRDVC